MNPSPQKSRHTSAGEANVNVAGRQCAFTMAEPHYMSSTESDELTRRISELAGGLPPVAFRKPISRSNTHQKATPWVLHSFSHPERTDDLVLSHWVKASDMEEGQEYPFAKFNRSVHVLEYTDEEYEKYLKNPNWTKEDTDQLFQLCRQYDLRFPVITDRYTSETTRTMEDLKDRFYSVNRKVLRGRAHSGSGDPSQDHQTMLQQYAYDKSKEVERKQGLQALFDRSEEQLEEEEGLFMEAKRIEHNETRLTREREAVLSTLHLEQVQQTPMTPLTPTSAGTLSTPGSISIAGGTSGPPSADVKKKRKSGLDESIIRKARRISNASSTVEEPLPDKKEKLVPGVYVRSLKLSGIKPAMQQKALKALSDLGIGTRPGMPTAQVCQKYETLQNAVVHMLELRKIVEKLEPDHRNKARDANHPSSAGSSSREKRRK